LKNRVAAGLRNTIIIRVSFAISSNTIPFSLPTYLPTGKFAEKPWFLVTLIREKYFRIFFTQVHKSSRENGDLRVITRLIQSFETIIEFNSTFTNFRDANWQHSLLRFYSPTFQSLPT
jgi:hypothetical protein